MFSEERVPGDAPHHGVFPRDLGNGLIATRHGDVDTFAHAYDVASQVAVAVVPVQEFSDFVGDQRGFRSVRGFVLLCVRDVIVVQVVGATITTVTHRLTTICSTR